MKNKRLLSLVLCICMTMSLFVGVAGTAANADGFSNGGYTYTYTVQANGTTVESICRAFSLSYPTCAEAVRILNGWTTMPAALAAGTEVLLPNGVTVAEWIKNGTIKISSPSNPTPTANPTSTTTTTTNKLLAGDSVSYYLIPHSVASGETLYSVCNSLGVNYNTSSTQILNMSGINNVNNIKAGKVVYIPTTTAPKTGSFYAVVAHKVASGETLTSICTNYGINYSNFTQVIAGLNDGINLNFIKAGNVVYIPTPGSIVQPTIQPTVQPTIQPTVAPETGYAITFAATGNGMPAASVDGHVVTKADAGKTVTILPNAYAGYAVQSIKVIRADNNSEIPTANNTFIMPAIGVRINVTYSKGDYSINCITTTHGTYRVLVCGTDGDCANFGDEILVEVAPDDGFVVDKVTYQKSNNKISSAVVEDDDNDGVYRFLMPKYSININVAFKQANYQTLHDAEMILQSAAASGIAKEQFKVTYEVNGKKISGALAPVGGIITMKVSVPSGGAVEDIVINGDKTIPVTDLGNNIFTFKMPNAETNVRVVITDDSNRMSYELSSEAHSSTSFVLLTVEDAETGKITTEAKTAKPGDKVSIVAYPLSQYKYISSSATGGAIIKTDGTNDYFIMPPANVKVTPNFAYDGVTKYGLQKCDSNTWSFSAYGSDGVEKYCFEAGEKVTVVAHPADGYELDTATYNYIATANIFGLFMNTDRVYMKASVKNNSFTFTMPAAYVDLTMNFKQSASSYVNVTTEAWTEGGVLDSTLGRATVLVNGSQPSRTGDLTWTVPTGAKVVLDVQPAVVEGVEYEVKEVKVVNSSTTSKVFGAKTVKLDENGQYSFTVLPGDKNLTAGVIVKVTYGVAQNNAKKYNVLYAAPESEQCKYTFTVTDKKGNTVPWSDGTIGAKSSNITVEPGNYVRIDIPACPGYEFQKLYLDETDRIPAAGAEKNSYTFTFLMPEHDVKTEVIFARAALKITRATATKGTFNIQVLDQINPSTASQGDIVKVILNPDPGCVIDSENSTITPADGTKTKFSEKPYNMNLDTGSNDVITFVMPGNDVTVTVVYKEDKYNVKYSDSTQSLIDSAKITASATPTSAAKDADVTVEIKSADAAKYVIDKDRLYVNETQITSFDSSRLPYAEEIAGGYKIHFKMPGEDAIITAGILGAGHKITAASVIADKISYCPVLGNTGETIEFAIIVPNGARISKIVYNDGSDHTLFSTADASYEGTYDNATGKANFTMPDADVTIKEIAVEYPVNVVYDHSIGVVPSGDIQYFTPGAAADVEIKTNSAEYVVDTVKYSYTITNPTDPDFGKEKAGEMTKAGDIYTLAAMPTEKVTVNVEFKKVLEHSVKVTPLVRENYKVYVNGTKMDDASIVVAKDTIVNVLIVPDKGYAFIPNDPTVTVTGASPVGPDNHKTENGYLYTFTMRDVDVTVDISGTPVESPYKATVTTKSGMGFCSAAIIDSAAGKNVSELKTFAGDTVYVKTTARSTYYIPTKISYVDKLGIEHKLEISDFKAADGAPVATPAGDPIGCVGELKTIGGEKYFVVDYWHLTMPEENINLTVEYARVPLNGTERKLYWGDSAVTKDLASEGSGAIEVYVGGIEFGQVTSAYEVVVGDKVIVISTGSDEMKYVDLFKYNPTTKQLVSQIGSSVLAESGKATFNMPSVESGYGVYMEVHGKDKTTAKYYSETSEAAGEVVITAPEAISALEPTPEVVPETVPETVPEAVPEAVPEIVPEILPQPDIPGPVQEVPAAPADEYPTQVVIGFADDL